MHDNSVNHPVVEGILSWIGYGRTIHCILDGNVRQRDKFSYRGRFYIRRPHYKYNPVGMHSIGRAHFIFFHPGNYLV